MRKMNIWCNSFSSGAIIMRNRRIIHYYSLIVFLCFLFWGSQKPAIEKSSTDKQSVRIAGHQVLKVFNDENSWLGGKGHLLPTVIFQDSKGAIWVGSKMYKIIERYEERIQQWTVFGEKPANYYNRLHYYGGAIIPEEITSIGESKDGKLWFSAGLTISASFVSPCFVSSFDGKQWEKWEIKPSPKEIVRIGLFSGQSARLWFWKGDELMSNDGQGWSRPLKLSNEIKDPRPITSDGQLKVENTNTLAHSQKVRYEIFAALQDQDGYIWLGTVSGAIRFDERRREWKKYSQIKVSPIDKIYQDKYGRLWFSDGWSNVEVYDIAKDSIITYNLLDHIRPAPNDEPVDLPLVLRAIYQDSQGQMFFALNRGLLVFSEAAGKWELFDLKDIGLPYGIENIMEDKYGRIWITASSGIAILDQL